VILYATLSRNHYQVGDNEESRNRNYGRRTMLADRYKNQRLNSPNDIVFHSTDPVMSTATGPGGKTLYITAHTSLYRIKLSTEGLVYSGN